MTSLITRPRRLVATALAAGAAILAFPAAGHAATTFGNDLNDQPSNSGECEGLPGGCTEVLYNAPGMGGDNTVGAPVDGIITKWRIRAHGGGDGGGGTFAAQITLRLATITIPDPGNQDIALAQAVATGPTVTVPATGPEVLDTPITEFAAQLPVKKGQYLAIDGTNVHATHNSSSGTDTYVYSPQLVQGEGPRANTDVKEELLLQADIEPDADGDGFGDETQDGCPTQATNQGACDTTQPGLSGVSFNGSRIKYTLSEAAAVQIRVEKGKKGRRVRGKCRKVTRKNRLRKKCTRYVRVKSLSQDGKAGVNVLPIPGKKLGPGRYRLKFTITDPHGNVRKATLKFRIRRR
jgi:hypothetical protein